MQASALTRGAWVALNLYDRDTGGPTCPACGDPQIVDVLEYWPADRSFMLNTCCEAVYADAVDEMQEWSRLDWRDFFAASTGLPLRTIVHLEGRLALDFGLHLAPVTQAVAKEFVRRHHRHHRPPAGWRWGHGVWNREDLIGVAMVGRPVARGYDPAEVVEVNRVAVRDDLGRLAWNACSMLYGAAAREAKRRGYRLIVTYTLASEDGTTLRAAGWTRAARIKGRSWSSPSRPRKDKHPTEDKLRWERTLT